MEYSYSIIIPHYNSSSLLNRMLKSIPEREDIQVIVVDDCSKIDEVEKLKKLQHKNLELYLQSENHGAGYARNIGLDKVKGDWTIVVDSDDVFANHAFDKFDENLTPEIDVLCFCIKCIDASTGQKSAYKDISDESVRLYLKKKNHYTKNRLKYRNTVCWNKLVSSKFLRLNNILFENCEVNNDVFYALQVCHKARNIKVIPDELYFYYINSGSITHKKRSIEREYLFYLQVQKRNGLYKKLGLMKYPFYRPTYYYFPYMIMKKGLIGAFEFFNFLRHHHREIEEARKSYLIILK